MRGSSLRLALAVLLLLPASGAAAGDLGPVEECTKRNAPTKASLREISLVSVDRTGGERKLVGKLYYKRRAEKQTGLLMRFDEPPDVRGSSYLMTKKASGEEEMFVYLPDIERVRRIHPDTASGSLFGTDFSYEDLKYLQMLESITLSERLPDGDVSGRPAYRVRVSAKPGERSAYDHVDTWVDKETCLPLRIDFFGDDDELMKQLTTDLDTLSQEGSVWIARSVTLRDLRNETSTNLEVDGVEMDGKVPDRLFTLSNLERGR